MSSFQGWICTIYIACSECVLNAGGVCIEEFQCKPIIGQLLLFVVEDEVCSIIFLFVFVTMQFHFKRDEFLGRITEMLYFLPFSRSELNQLVERDLKIWQERVSLTHTCC